MIVEIVDGPHHIERLLARVEPAMKAGTITLERAHVALYRSGEAHAKARDVAPRCDVVATQDKSAALEVKTMTIPESGALLRIFIGESDREKGRDRPLYEAIVLRAREAHLAGATVLRGPMGFGRHSRMHSAKLLEISTDLPIVIEIVDAEEKINAFLPVVDELVTEGLVTLEAVRVLKYAAPPRRAEVGADPSRRTSHRREQEASRTPARTQPGREERPHDDHDYCHPRPRDPRLPRQPHRRGRGDARRRRSRPRRRPLRRLDGRARGRRAPRRGQGPLPGQGRPKAVGARQRRPSPRPSRSLDALDQAGVDRVMRGSTARRTRAEARGQRHPRRQPGGGPGRGGRHGAARSTATSAARPPTSCPCRCSTSSTAASTPTGRARTSRSS